MYLSHCDPLLATLTAYNDRKWLVPDTVAAKFGGDEEAREAKDEGE